jgi:hypothetical protein
VVNQRTSSTRYRLLLIPFRAGEARPEISSAKAGSGARVAWQGQEDEIQLQLGADQRTRVAVRRAGREILRSK